MRHDSLLTKIDMARVIIQALYNLPALPAADHPKVTRRATLNGKILRDQYKMALAAIRSIA